MGKIISLKLSLYDKGGEQTLHLVILRPQPKDLAERDRVRPSAWILRYALLRSE